MVSTATYQASISGFMKHLDMSSESAQELMRSGVHLAQEAVQQFVSSNNDTGVLLINGLHWGQEQVRGDIVQ